MTSSYPLAWPDGWPREARRKERSPFATTYDRALKHLLNELRLLGARNIVVSSNVPIRQDGMPYGDAARRRINDPGVALYFSLGGKPMVMARDLYWTPHENLRSLGLAVEHLRGLERHGGATMMQRAFQGFTALPTPKTWREILGIPAGAEVSQETVQFFWREAARRNHPDAGGSHARMAEINAARDAAIKELNP